MSADDAKKDAACTAVHQTIGVLLDGPDGAYREPSDGVVIDVMDHCTSCSSCERMLERLLETATEEGNPRSVQAKTLLRRALRLASARLVSKLEDGLGMLLGPFIDGLLERGLHALSEAKASKRTTSERPPPKDRPNWSPYLRSTAHFWAVFLDCARSARYVPFVPTTRRLRMSAPVSCDRLKSLMNELLVDLDGCELARMDMEARHDVIRHLDACDVCQEFMDEDFEVAVETAEENHAERILQKVTEMLMATIGLSGPPSSPSDAYDGDPD